MVNLQRTGPPSRSESFVIRLPDGAEYGPLTASEARELVNQRSIPPTAFIRRFSSTKWQLVSDLTSRSTPNPQANTDRHEPPSYAPTAPFTAPRPQEPGPQPTPNGTIPEGQPDVAPFPAFELRTTSKSTGQGEDSAASIVFAVLGLAVVAGAIAVVFWVKSAYGLTPYQSRGIVKFAALAVPALLAGSWAYLKACRVVK